MELKPNKGKKSSKKRPTYFAKKEEKQMSDFYCGTKGVFDSHKLHQSHKKSKQNK
jgi:hypothetical protein